MTTKLRINGHKLIRSRSGAQSGYHDGRCECGRWFFRGWTNRARSVLNSHRGHLERIKNGSPIKGTDI
jgi:hypothetical protein